MKQVLALIRRTLTEIFHVTPKPFVIDKGLLRGDGVLYVADDEGRVVGTVGVKKHMQGVARLKTMYVERPYRSKGLANMLLAKAHRFANLRGFHTLILSTTPQMEAAIRFYKKNGFVKYRSNRRLNQEFFRKAL